MFYDIVGSNYYIMNLFDFVDRNAISAISPRDYAAANPFPHCVIDNFLNANIAQKILLEFPDDENEIWWKYDNVLERKSASDDLRRFPVTIAKTIHALNHQSFIDQLQLLTGIDGLMSDPYLHGGGLHCIKPGGKLDMHVDYGVHPKLGLERRLNLILYLVPPTWNEAWGGKLEFWSGGWNGDKPYLIEQKTAIAPKFNRAVIFSTGDLSFHGHPEPLQSPVGIYRRSIALYYLSEIRPGIQERYRAYYVARPGIDPTDEQTERFRQERSKMSGKY